MLGVLVTSYLIKKALDNYFNTTMAMIIGLMIGTIPGLYVGFSIDFIILNSIFFLLGANTLQDEMIEINSLSKSLASVKEKRRDLIETYQKKIEKQEKLIDELLLRLENNR